MHVQQPRQMIVLCTVRTFPVLHLSVAESRKRHFRPAKQAGRQAGRQASKQAGRQAGKQTAHGAKTKRATNPDFEFSETVTHSNDRRSR